MRSLTVLLLLAASLSVLPFAGATTGTAVDAACVSASPSGLAITFEDCCPDLCQELLCRLVKDCRPWGSSLDLGS